MLFKAWLNSQTFDELRLIPSIICEGEWKNQPQVTTQFLMGPGQLHSTKQVVEPACLPARDQRKIPRLPKTRRRLRLMVHQTRLRWTVPARLCVLGFSGWRAGEIFIQRCTGWEKILLRLRKGRKLRRFELLSRRLKG